MMEVHACLPTSRSTWDSAVQSNRVTNMDPEYCMFPTHKIFSTNYCTCETMPEVDVGELLRSLGRTLTFVSIWPPPSRTTAAVRHRRELCSSMTGSLQLRTAMHCHHRHGPSDGLRWCVGLLIQVRASSAEDENDEGPGSQTDDLDGPS